MGRRLLGRWEALSGQRRVLWGIPLSFALLFAFHEAFFPLLNWQRSLTYAVMECVPMSLLLAWVTQNELRRHALAQERAGGAEPSIDPPV